jgi:hypothetical protein
MKKETVLPFAVVTIIVLGATAFFLRSLVSDQNVTENNLPSTDTSKIKDIISPLTVRTNGDTVDIEKVIPQAKISTAGWKTCRNEKYRYEFKFPGEWYIYSGQTYGADVPTGDIEVQSCSAEDIVNEIIVRPKERIDEKPHPRVQVLFVPAGGEAEMTSDEEIFRHIMEGRRGRPSEYYLVGNEWAVFYDDALYHSKFVMLMHKGRLVRIIMNNVSLDESDTILSTFKFID